jgi:hypothetical protein
MLQSPVLDPFTHMHGILSMRRRSVCHKVTLRESVKQPATAS